MSPMAKMLFSKYGPLLSYEQLAEVLHKTAKSLMNDYSSGRLRIKTFKEGRERVAHVEHVAEYLELRAQSAEIPPDL